MVRRLAGTLGIADQPFRGIGAFVLSGQLPDGRRSARSFPKRRFEELKLYETEAKLDAYEEDSSVLFVAPALLSESELSQTFNPTSMRRHSIR